MTQSIMGIKEPVVCTKQTILRNPQHLLVDLEQYDILTNIISDILKKNPSLIKPLNLTTPSSRSLSKSLNLLPKTCNN